MFTKSTNAFSCLFVLPQLTKKYMQGKRPRTLSPQRMPSADAPKTGLTQLLECLQHALLHVIDGPLLVDNLQAYNVERDHGAQH